MVTPSGVVTPFYGPFNHLISHFKLKRVEPAAPVRSTPNEHTPIPYGRINPDVAKVAIAQVNKRLDGHLALKTATESRATVLATNCVAVLTVVVGATLYDFRSQGFSALVMTGIVGGMCLLQSLMHAYLVIRPSTITLPGHLPSQIWGDLTDPNMKEPDFIARLLSTSQQQMEENEHAQNEKGKRLRTAIASAILSIPLSAISFVIFRQFL